MRRMLLASVMMMVVLAWPAFGADNKPIKVLIITGDHGHDWKKTTPFLRDILTKAGMTVDVTETPAKDLTADNLAKYDALLLNYKDTKKGGSQTQWSEENKKAFTDAVAGGKGLLVYHHASSAFTSGSEFDKSFELVIAGGWRKEGYPGKKHVSRATNRKAGHPIMTGMPAQLQHKKDQRHPDP